VLLFAAGLATLRKTSIIAPLAALAVLAAYRPRRMLRLAPLGLALLIAVHVLAPQALGNVGAQFTDGFLDAGTTRGRTADYEAIAPDVAAHPLFGRGFGTIDPARSDTYRILDNQYLGQLVQVGFLGLAAYLALLVAALQLTHRTALHARDPDLRLIGLGSLAGFVGFGVANALFDLLSFWEVPYLFFFFAALCTIAAGERARAPRALGVQAQPA
jgi:O-antigen ligase